MSRVHKNEYFYLDSTFNGQHNLIIIYTELIYRVK